MNQQFRLIATLASSIRDLLPIVLVVAFFQLVVLRQPLPAFGDLLGGLLLIWLGLAFFIHGLEQGLFPLGESISYAFARKANLYWLLLFAFALGFGTTIAKPALIAVAIKAHDISGSTISVWGLRVTAGRWRWS